MFPKAHAAAYVMMAYRIAYCKINYPLAYYAAYFGIRASAFSYELMGQGKEKLLYHMKEYKRRAELNQLSKKDQDTLKDMKNVLEMYARGFDFYRSISTNPKHPSSRSSATSSFHRSTPLTAWAIKPPRLWKLPLKTDHTSLKTISVREQKSARHWLT